MHNERGKIEFADRLRGIAAVAVMLSHFYGLFWKSPAAIHALTGLPTLPERFGVPIYVALLNWFDTFNWGAFGVGLFFLVSGFVIPFSLSRYNPLAFLAARVMRLVPTYVVGFSITLISLWAAHRYFSTPFDLTLTEMASHAIPGVRDMMGTRVIDGVVWTLEIEVKFYLLCAAVAPWIRRGSPLVLLAPAGVAALYFVNRQYSGLLVGHTFLLRLSEVLSVYAQFLIFMFLGTVMHMVHRRIWRPELAMFAFASIAAVITYMFVTGFQKGDPIIACSYGAALIVFLTASAWPRLVPGGRVASFFADISYPLYVLHNVMGFSALLVLIDLGMKRTIALVLVTAVAIGLSVIVHYLVEEPTKLLARAIGVRLSKSSCMSALP